MKFRMKKDDLRSAVFITLSLILMASSLYVGLVKGRNDIDENLAKNDLPTYGLEDLVTNDNVKNAEDEEKTVDVVLSEEESSEDAEEEKVNEEEEEHIEETINKEVVSISLSYPVSERKIVMDYSFGEEPVYSKTFNEYRADHSGIDISAKEGEEVFSAAEGTVTDVYEDERLGFTVKISHDGYETSYSNLERGVFVKKGDNVTTETALGRVGNSAIYESAEDSHVHFSLYVNGSCTDPKDYLEE